MRIFLRLFVHLASHSFLEGVADDLANGDENTQQTEEEIVLAALDSAADEKLTNVAIAHRSLHPPHHSA